MPSASSPTTPPSALSPPPNRRLFHDRAASVEYRPVLRHPASYESDRSTSTYMSPQAERTKGDIGFKYDRVHSTSKGRRFGAYVRSFASWANLGLICYVLHGLLIVIHAALLALHSQGVDRHIAIPFEKSYLYSVVLIVGQQTFFTIYQGALVVLTQQLALRSNLLRRQTLTALHDKSLAWGGLGASILSLWRQGTLPTAVCGTLSVVLYLISISILHVTSSSLLDVESYGSTFPTLSRTNLATPNMTAVMETFGEDSWAVVSTIASAIGQLPLAFNYGFSNNTVYDILFDTTGTGNVTVNATTFNVQCYSATSVEVSYLDNSVVIDWGNLSVTYAAFPLYEGVLWFNGQTYGDTPQGRYLTFFSSPSIPDSAGNTGTELTVADTIHSVVAGGPDMSVFANLQAMLCSLSYTLQTAILDAKNNAILSLSPKTEKPRPTWEQSSMLTSQSRDVMVDWFSQAFNSIGPTSLSISPSTQCGETVSCTLSLLNVCVAQVISFLIFTKHVIQSVLLDMLGLKINTTTFAGGNLTVMEQSNATLSQLEDALGVIAAQVFWTAGHINITTPTTVTQTSHQVGEAKIQKSIIRSRLHINVVPTSIGFVISTVLFILALIMTREGYHHDARGTYIPDNAGILQLLWLFSRQPEVRQSLYEVDEPCEDELRAAGLIDVYAGGHSSGRFDQ
ncbi:hypothetical protein F5I97DRAFT_437003 [Phlebopus sp. FC_14]|nr:hypothetical protein F5I97DRAFT_437003 [Phlebopus sp. FC_14]